MVRLLNPFVDLDEILYIGGDLDAIFSNPVPSTIPKWRTFTLLRWVQRNPVTTFELIVEFG
jgi:hypothetical protein